MSVIEVNESTFEKEVLKSGIPVIVDAWAEWCGPCRAYSPIIEETSKDYDGKIKFVKVNVDENQKIAEKYNIMSIPTTLFVVEGKVKSFIVGAYPKNMLNKWIEENFKK
ncbi:MAG: thioredoxin [Candidatus Marsarchaeota archaeon]|jgi:thioredoxin 1|nr:thioredoxin [Candidatus Marsarchaeota archaeon]